MCLEIAKISNIAFRQTFSWTEGFSGNGIDQDTTLWCSAEPVFFRFALVILRKDRKKDEELKEMALKTWTSTSRNNTQCCGNRLSSSL
jgi:hypothetical protein